MNIGIDARRLSDENPAGVGRYLIEILTYFSRQNNDDNYYLFSNRPILKQYIFNKRFHCVYMQNKIGTLWMLFELPKHLTEYNLDVFWGPEHMLPPKIKGVRYVLTVHDIALLINPKWGSRKNAIMQNIFCRLSCKRADKIIAVSEATKKDIVSLLSIDANRITAILNGGGTSSI